MPSETVFSYIGFKMKSKTIFVSLIAFAAWTTTGASTEGISVEHPGPQHTFVRVNPDLGRYLMIPVEEDREDEMVTIIADGRQEGTFYVRLAQNKVDYEVPFDLTPYKGKNIILDFKKQTRGSGVSVPDSVNVGLQSFSYADTFDTTNTENYRPLYHHTPLYGWMNDPNGMVYKDGKWHLYYQWNPYGSKWQNMTWGHSVSEDLIHWESLPPAIAPDALGAIFSGSAAVDHTGSAGFGEDAIVAMYTSAGHSQMQSIAHSNDGGTTFEVYPGNPVITMKTEARDPKIFFNKETGEWNMVLAHALNHEVLFFSSPDLKNWTRTDAFGKVGATGGVWECPDLFELEVEGTGEKKWVLIVNLNPGGPFGGSATQYFIGDFKDGKFIPDRNADGEIETKWMDFGKDFYATVTWSDAPADRRVALGWMSNWEYADQVPTMQYRSANTLPRDLSLFRDTDGEIYLAGEPSPEVLKIRGKEVAGAAKMALSAAGKKFSLPKVNDGICEITADVKASGKGTANFTLSNSDGEKVTVSYDAATNEVTFDRMHGTFTDIAHSFPAVTKAPAYGSEGKVSLRIFVDKSSVEVFVNDGKSTMTNLVFPEKPYTTLTVSGTGKAEVANLKVYEIKTK